MTEQRNDAGTVQQELLDIARALDRGSQRLIAAVREFEGGPDEDGVWRLGVQLRFESAVTASEEQLVNAWDDSKRLPAQDRLRRMAVAAVERTDPELHADFHRLKSEIDLLKTVISARKTSISARQSVLSAERSMGR